MPLPFDATLKDLVQTYPRDWLALLGTPAGGPVRVLSPDLSTLTAFADVVLQTGDRHLHLDFQSGPDPALPRRILLYNVLLYETTGLPVHSVVVVLRPRADHSSLTGTVAYQAWPGRGGLEFTFEVVRVWELPVEGLLAGGPGVLPLASLGRLPEGVPAEEGLAGVVERMVDRIVREVGGENAPVLLTAAYVLAGMRVSRERALELFQGVRAMRESTTYQAILDEGRAEGRAEGWAKGRAEGRIQGQAEEAHKILLRQGSKRFDRPDAGVEAALRGITDLERLERLSERLLEAATWQELLATP